MEPWLWLVLIVVGLLAVAVIYWWLIRARAMPPPPVLPEEWHPALPAPEVPEADDLAEIEGLGPHIHDVLHDAGIKTFAQLAETPASRIREILAELPNPPDPESWPAQARLAAESRWQELEELRQSLREAAPR